MVVGSLGAGGAERVVATMANAWRNAGHEVWIISTYLGPSVTAYALRAGISVISLAEVMNRTRRPCPPLVLRKIRALRTVLSTIEPDVIISFLTNVNVLAILANLGSRRAPLIISERTDALHDSRLPRTLRLARFLCYRRADALVVQTAAAARRYVAQPDAVPLVTVISNPLPAELAMSATRASHDSEGGCVVAMGRLTPEKGYFRLIEAFASALGADESWQLRIWGDGPLREDLQRLVDRLRLTERVRLCGVTSQPWSALAEGQIYVLSSEYEGFPNAMLEAMALGLPCIAFDCPSGPRALADNGRAAILVPPGDIGELAAAIQKLAGDRELRRALGVHAADLVRSSFAEATVMAKWDVLVSEVTRPHRGDAACHPH